MKKILISTCLTLCSFYCFSQEKIGLFKNVHVGLTLSYFHNFQGENKYLLKQDASVDPIIENKNGAALSVVILFPLEESNKWNFLLNLNIADAKNENLTFFNSQTPFGTGFSFFPFKKTPSIGFSVMANFGRQDRMYDAAIEKQYFPIADYPNYNLKVGAPVPSGVLQPFYYKQTTVSLATGFIIRI